MISVVAMRMGVYGAWCSKMVGSSLRCFDMREAEKHPKWAAGVVSSAIDDIRVGSPKHWVGTHLMVSVPRQGFELAVWPARAGPRFASCRLSSIHKHANMFEANVPT